MENDWANVRRLCTLLKKFYELRVSGSLYVTSNTHVDEIGNVLDELKNCMQSDDLNMRSIAVKMRKKYNKYWGSWKNMNMLTYIAVLLDPLIKLEVLGYVLDDIFSEGAEVLGYALVTIAVELYISHCHSITVMISRLNSLYSCNQKNIT